MLIQRMRLHQLHHKQCLRFHINGSLDQLQSMKKQLKRTVDFLASSPEAAGRTITPSFVDLSDPNLDAAEARAALGRRLDQSSRRAQRGSHRCDEDGVGNNHGRHPP